MSKSLRKLTPVPYRQVSLLPGFWETRNRVNREATMPVGYEQCRQTGRLAAFKLDWKPGQKNRPHIFWDSDVAKWIEAAGLSLGTHPDKTLEDKVDQVIDWIEKAQQKDGYLNTYFTVVEPEGRWRNLQDEHELYCAGHLMEAAVAYYEGTGKGKLLDVMCRYADYIDSVFGRGRGKKRGYPGHEEIELALVKLYRTTGAERYLKLASYFVEERGQQPHYFEKEAKARGEKKRRRHRAYEEAQAHLPVREQTTAEGHAVRALYLYAGMADVAAETGDRSLLKACRTLWNNIVEKRMYIHGGVGSTQRGERFTFDYDLPNESAYAETCAAISLVFFARRMLDIEVDGAYADVMERALYNNVLSGVSLDGRHFFYDNLLASKPGVHRFSGQRPPARQPWFGCACCPTNIVRLLAGIGGYMTSQTRRAMYFHLYGASEVTVHLAGQPVHFKTTTRYPWKETVKIEVKPEAPGSFEVALRIPGWCHKPEIAVNGKRVRPPLRKGYAMLQRTWKKGDRILLTLPMPVERIEAHPAVRHNAGRVALQRGPVVYCLEEADNGPDLNDLALDPKARLVVTQDKTLGVPTIRTRGSRRFQKDWKGTLYRPAGSKRERKSVTAIPYCLWANRGDGEMLVWVRQD